VFTIDDRRWRVRGLDDITSHNTMRVNLMVGTGDHAAYHLDLVELYSGRQRQSFIKAASIELNADETALKKDLGTLLLHLERKVDARLRDTLEEDRTQVVVPLSDTDREAALRFLRAPNLLGRVADDLATLGVVGEERNKKIAYLAVISRKLPKPLAVIIQSSPAAGKSALLDAILKLVPDEDVLAFSAITGRSLYYLPADGVRHKVLALAEEEGAGKASYALKLLQSEGSLSIASTAKDSKSGRLSTQTYAVAGPVALLMTTTSLSVDEELLSRCIVLSADEGRNQTRAIHREQRRRLTLEGLVARSEADRVVKLHHDAQRLLRPLHVVVPDTLDIDFASHRVRCRRDHAKVLGLVQAVALLRQHQRPIKQTDRGVSYIEATAEDVAVALELLAGLDRIELPPGTRAFLEAVVAYVTGRAEADEIAVADVRFTRRELREAMPWANTQVKVHLGRLVDLELVLRHRGMPPVYELVYNGEDILSGTQAAAHRSSHSDPDRPGLGRRVAGGQPGDDPADA